MDNLIKDTETISSLVIAEITGKRHDSVLRAIRKMEEAWVKVGQHKFAETSYIDKSNRESPMYQLTKSETLYIATKFNDEARAKLILRWQKLETEKKKPLSNLDMIQLSIDTIRANQKELEEVKEDIKMLKAQTNTQPDYFTIAGYGTLQGLKVNLKLASNLGRKASKICKDKGFETDSIPDPRFGRVKLYPKEVLQQVFQLAL